MIRQGLILCVFIFWNGGSLGNAELEDDDLDHSAEWKGEHNRIVYQVLNNVEISTFRPHHHSNAVVVQCFVLLQSFGEINAISMDYTVDIDLYVQWNDDRLRHNSTTLIFQTVESIKKFWLPDLYFENEKNGALHTVLSENIALSLEPDGNITYSTRLTLKLSCRMDFHQFPLDVQLCALKIKSYAYSNEHMILMWSPEHSIISDGEASMPQYRVTNISTWSQFDSMPLGNHSTILAQFRLERSLGYFIINLFLPSLLLVIISWVSFWLHVDATAARASLGITSVLTLVTQTGALRYIIPSLSYPTAMDVWFSVCMCFVFAALIEFSMVNYFYILSVRASNKELAAGVPAEPKSISADVESTVDDCKETNSQFHRYVGQTSLSMEDLTANSRKRHGATIVRPRKRTKTETYHRRARGFLKTAERIDKTCRILFPGTFVVFSIVFWIRLLKATNGQVTL